MSDTVPISDYLSVAKQAEPAFEKEYRDACAFAGLPAIGVVIHPRLDRKRMRPGARIWFGEPDLSHTKSRVYKSIALDAFVSAVNRTAGFPMLDREDMVRTFRRNRGTIVSFDRVGITAPDDWTSH